MVVRAGAFLVLVWSSQTCMAARVAMDLEEVEEYGALSADSEEEAVTATRMDGALSVDSEEDVVLADTRPHSNSLGYASGSSEECQSVIPDSPLRVDEQWTFPTAEETDFDGVHKSCHGRTKNVGLELKEGKKTCRGAVHIVSRRQNAVDQQQGRYPSPTRRWCDPVVRRDRF